MYLFSTPLAMQQFILKFGNYFQKWDENTHTYKIHTHIGTPTMSEKTISNCQNQNFTFWITCNLSTVILHEIFITKSTRNFSLIFISGYIPKYILNLTRKWIFISYVIAINECIIIIIFISESLLFYFLCIFQIFVLLLKTIK